MHGPAHEDIIAFFLDTEDFKAHGIKLLLGVLKILQ
jgi:hypothetical protein